MLTITINLKHLLHHRIEFELPDESYSESDIQDYFVYIIKKHETFTTNLPIYIYVKKMENQ